jgi:hypothetical protein
MGRKFVLLLFAALALAGVVHAFDAMDASSSCPLESSSAGAGASEADSVDFLFAPASVWRHLSQEHDLDLLSSRASGR